MMRVIFLRRYKSLHDITALAKLFDDDDERATAFVAYIGNNGGGDDFDDDYRNFQDDYEGYYDSLEGAGRGIIADNHPEFNDMLAIHDFRYSFDFAHWLEKHHGYWHAEVQGYGVFVFSN
jgi:antirestriction protein